MNNNKISQSSQEASKNGSEQPSGSIANTIPEGERRCHCSWEPHFYRMNSGLAWAIYSWGRSLSYKSNSFHVSIDYIAKHFGCDRKTVIEALREMVDSDWAEIRHKEPGRPVAYRFIDHDEWAIAHPDCCIVKDSSPWENEKHDLLAQRLHAASDGNAHFFPGQMKGLRKSDLSDDEIFARWEAFLQANPHKGKMWERVYYHFHAHLFKDGKPAPGAAKATPVTDSCNDQSAGTDLPQSAGTGTGIPTVGTHLSPLERTQGFEVEGLKEGLTVGIDTASADLPASKPTALRTSSAERQKQKQEKSEMQTGPEERLKNIEARLENLDWHVGEARRKRQEAPEWALKEQVAYQQEIEELVSAHQVQLSPWLAEWVEKRRLKAEQQAEHDRRWDLTEKAIARVWEALKLSPDVASSSFRGFLWHFVHKAPDASIHAHLENTLTYCQDKGVPIAPEILAAQEHLAAEVAESEVVTGA